MRIHPLMAGAAVSVIVLSGVGVAALTGHLPGSRAEKAPEQTAQRKAPAQQTAKAHPKASTPAPAASAKPHVADKEAKAAPCVDCGVVVEVRQVEVKGKGTGMGAVAGGVAGAVLGHEIGESNTGTVLGAAGGAVVGHQIERQVRTTTRFHVDVRMGDGTVKTVVFDKQPSWKNGDRVRLQDGKLTSRDQANGA